MRAAIAAAILLSAGVAAADPLPQQPAAEIDPARFAQATPFTVPPSPEGVARLRVGPAVLAAARADLGDLRVVDAARRQWPYVIRAERYHEDLPLSVSRSQEDRGASRYTLAPATAPVPVDEVTLVIDRPFFDRSYRLFAETASGAFRREALASGRLTRATGGPAEVTVPFLRQRVTAFALVVDDGDEAPLPLTQARASIPVAELWIVAPAGSYVLLAGDPDAEAPRYEIASIRERVLKAAAPACAAGTTGPNPQRRGRLDPGEGFEKTALWGVMGLAVVLLLTLTLRLSRREAEGEHGPNNRG